MSTSWDRRTLLKFSAALPALCPLSSFSSTSSQRNTNTGISLYFHEDAIMMRQNAAPFATQKILQWGSDLAPGVTYNSKDLFCPLSTLNSDKKSYFLIASPQLDSFCYRIFCVDHENFNTLQKNLIAEFDSFDIDQNGLTFLSEHKSLLSVSFLTEKLHLFVFDKEISLLSIITVEKNGRFHRLNFCDLKMPKTFSFHTMPREVFCNTENVFLLINEEKKSQEFWQLCADNDEIAGWQKLTEFQHNYVLHENWSYQFSSFVSASDQKAGDQYFMLLQYDRLTPHAFLFVRSDGRLAAMTFEKSNASYRPSVLGVSDKKYDLKNTHFYGVYFDHTQQKDVIFCQDYKTKKPFFLSLEKNAEGYYGFAETPVDLAVSDEKVRGYLHSCFSSNTKIKNMFLLPSQHTDVGVPLQLFVCNDVGESKETFQIYFQKKGSCFTTHIETSSTALIKSGLEDTWSDNIISFFSDIHAWSKKYDYTPYGMMGLLLFTGFLIILGMQAKRQLSILTNSGGTQEQPADDKKPLNPTAANLVEAASPSPAVVIGLTQEEINEQSFQVLEAQHHILKSYEMASTQVNIPDYDKIAFWAEAALSKDFGHSIFHPFDCAITGKDENRVTAVQQLRKILTSQKPFEIYNPKSDEAIKTMMDNLDQGKVSLKLFHTSLKRDSVPLMLQDIISWDSETENIHVHDGYKMQDALLGFWMNSAINRYCHSILILKNGHFQTIPQLQEPAVKETWRPLYNHRKNQETLKNYAFLRLFSEANSLPTYNFLSLPFRTHFTRRFHQQLDMTLRNHDLQIL